jgi:hypothetical protein
VAELLAEYPELEEFLIARAHVFEKLRNPVLRRTVAKVATVRQAAEIAGIPVDELLRELRQAAGLDPTEAAHGGTASEEASPACGAKTPEWFDPEAVIETIDADALLEAGKIPLGRVLRAANKLEGKAMLRVVAGFRPAPLADALETRGFTIWVRELAPGRFELFVIRA